MGNTKAYRYFAGRQHMEVLRVASVVARAEVQRVQHLRYALDINTPPAAVGCCGNTVPTVDHFAGQSPWVTCSSRVDGSTNIGLATLTDLENSRCPFAGTAEVRDEPSDDCQQTVCDWSAVERKVLGREGEYNSDGSDVVISDLFSGRDVFADPTLVERTLTQVVTLGFRPSACPITAARGVCNGVGYCHDGACVCSKGWGGPACDTFDCGDGCLNGGACTAGPGVCDCPTSHEGLHCEIARDLASYGCAVPDKAPPHSTMVCTGDGAPLSVCRYECDTGYAIKGWPHVTTVTRVCAGEGAWNGPKPLCLPVSCEAPKKPAHSQVVCRGNSIDDSCQVTCDDGFELSNVDSTVGTAVEATITCTYSESGLPGWTPIVECTRRHCGPLIPPENTLLEGCTKDSYGDTCSVQCLRDHEPESNGALTATCQADGRWSTLVDRCVPVDIP